MTEPLGWNDSEPPKDGSEIVIPLTLLTTVYWDDELEGWVLNKPIHLEILHIDILRWRRRNG